MHNGQVEGGAAGRRGRDFEYEVKAESGTRTAANAERLFCIDKLTQQRRVDPPPPPGIPPLSPLDLLYASLCIQLPF